MTEILERPKTVLPTLPLPLYSSVALADVTTDSGERLTITLGLDKIAVESFTRRSCDLSDTELQTFTSDYKRICEGGYEHWYAKERYPFALTDGEGALAGIIWFGPKEFPGLLSPLELPLLPSILQQPTSHPWHTFAIRLYPPYRGKRLAFPFATFVFGVHKRLFPTTAVWLDTQNDNQGAIALYKKLGFVECGQKAASDEGTAPDRLVMVHL